MLPLSWTEWPEASRRIFQGFRSAAGEEMMIGKNMFVERVLPAATLRWFEPEEMAEYRRPFANGREDRWPTLTWPREEPDPAARLRLWPPITGPDGETGSRLEELCLRRGGCDRPAREHEAELAEGWPSAGRSLRHRLDVRLRARGERARRQPKGHGAGRAARRRAIALRANPSTCNSDHATVGAEFDQQRP
jgi:hypothetical protein